jgi:hypothetical protein
VKKLIVDGDGDNEQIKNFLFQQASKRAKQIKETIMKSQGYV